jgi:hypothetical protein
MSLPDDNTSYQALNALIHRAAQRPEIPVLCTDKQAVMLYRRWNSALSARLDYTLEFLGDRSASVSVARAWLELRDEQPALRSLLDAQSARAAIQACAHQEAAMMALAAGLVRPGTDTPAAATLGGDYLTETRSVTGGRRSA